MFIWRFKLSWFDWFSYGSNIYETFCYLSNFYNFPCLRNFVRAPPAGVDFQFDYEVSYPVAMAIMDQDPNLEKMRYELVPKM